MDNIEFLRLIQEIDIQTNKQYNVLFSNETIKGIIHLWWKERGIQ